MSTPAELAYFDELWNARHEEISARATRKRIGG